MYACMYACMHVRMYVCMFQAKFRTIEIAMNMQTILHQKIGGAFYYSTTYDTLCHHDDIIHA